MPKASRRDITTTTPEEIRVELAPEGLIDPDVLEREGGALNAEAVQANRHATEAIAKKRAGTNGVPWGQENACPLLDDITRVYAAQTLSIFVQRLSGQPFHWYIKGEPRNGEQLYDMVMEQCHKRYQEAEYKITFKDKTLHYHRGIGRLSLPDTMDRAASPAPPTASVPLYSAGAPPGLGNAPSPWPASHQATSAPSAPSDVMMHHLFEAFTQLQQQVVELARRPATAATSPAAASAGAAFGLNGASPLPEGATIHVPGIGWVTRSKPPTVEPPAALSKPTSAVDEARGALATIQEMVRMTKEAQGLLPAPSKPAPTAHVEPELMKTLDLGEFKVVQNTEDGSLRPVETAIANADKIMSWIARERERFAQAQRQPAFTQQAPSAEPQTLPVQTAAAATAPPPAAAAAAPAHAQTLLSAPSLPTSR